jgi:hypothetical protein
MNNMEILDACAYKNEAYDKAGTTHCLGYIPGTGDWQAVYSCPFLQDGEVVGLCKASDIGPQLKIVLVESRSAPLSWTNELPKSNTKGRKFLSVEFHPGTDVGGEDTMGTGRPSGMSTIIKSTPPVVPWIPLKA